MHSLDPTSRLEAFLYDLYHRRGRGIVPGLEAVRGLLCELGNPHLDLRVVHVAGTNGKGSVCSMLESILRAAGYRTGLYTSPHLVRFNERIRVEGREIPDQDLWGLLEEIDVHADTVRDMSELRAPTFFEFTTALAFTHFKREAVDICVLETGLGGSWDATNVVEPLLSIITPIAKDHAAFLGDSLAGIAREKAGILKPSVPAVVGSLCPEALEVVREVAREKNVPLTIATDAVSVQLDRVSWEGQRLRMETGSMRYPPIQLPLAGPHQVENAAVTVAAIEALENLRHIEVGEKAVVQGLRDVDWPGRNQVLSRDPLVLLDCAHNPAGAEALRRAVEKVSPGRSVALVAGFSQDKDAVGFFRELAPVTGHCWAVPLNVERGVDPELAVQSARAAGVEATALDLLTARAEAEAWARRHDGIVVIAGSIYLAGEVLEREGMVPVAGK